MQHIVTESGFEIDMDASVLDDMEVFELIVKIDQGDVMSLPPLLAKIFSPEQKKALYDHCRKDDGRVPITAVSEEFGEILKGLREKN